MLFRTLLNVRTQMPSWMHFPSLSRRTLTRSKRNSTNTRRNNPFQVPGRPHLQANRP